MNPARFLQPRHFAATRAQLVFLAIVATAVLASAADEADPKSAALQVSLLTAADEKVTGPLLELRDGILKLDTAPPRSIALIDVQSLTFGSTLGVSAQWLGQDQRDHVQVGAPQAGNGIQDVHLRLRGLPAQKQIKQLRIVMRSPPHAWVMDPTGSPNWRLFVERAGTAGVADVFFEPHSADLHDKELQLTLTYADDSTEKITCKAATHTSDQLRMGASKAPAESGGAVESVVVADVGVADVVQGALVELTDDALTLKTSWQPKLQIPLLQVQGLLWRNATAEAKKRYDAARAKPGTEDLAIVLANDGKLAEIAGRLKHWEGQQLRFVYEGEERTIQSDRLQSLVFAAHPPVRPSPNAFQVVRLTTADSLSGVWQAFSGNSITLRTPWGAAWDIPIESVVEINTRNGNLVHLSDLQPATVEQTPYFSRLSSFRRDQALDGGPLKIKGKGYTRGLAVHSRSVLSYALDGQFVTFKTTVGFDDAAGNRGAVACRVLADGKELFSKPDLRADQDPQSLELSVKGVESLSLEVDFGDKEDIGDRIIWAEPRLFRK